MKNYYKNGKALCILIWEGLPCTLLNGKLQVQDSILYAENGHRNKTMY